MFNLDRKLLSFFLASCIVMMQKTCFHVHKENCLVCRLQTFALHFKTTAKPLFWLFRILCQLPNNKGFLICWLQTLELPFTTSRSIFFGLFRIFSHLPNINFFKWERL